MSKNILEIIERVKEAGGYRNEGEVATALKMTHGGLSNHKTRGTIPLEALLTYSETMAVSLDWLLTGEGPLKKGEGGLVREPQASYGDDIVFIPQVTGEISAGGGLIADNTVELRIAFRREWIERKGDSTKMSITRVKGDSMEPTLMSGDIVLIDHARNFVDPHGGIYAVAFGNEIMVKRIQILFPSEKLRVISDNPKYQPADVDPASVAINGKVIWFGRELER